MRSQLLAFSCALITNLLVQKVLGSCYYPDGSFPEDYVYVPCSDDEFTTCCTPSRDHQCLSNGLCLYPDEDFGYMLRGACTDQSWNSTNCFQHCKTESFDGYDKLVHCHGDRYCCYSDGDTCCNDDSNVFTVEPATVIKDLARTLTSTGRLPIATETDSTKTTDPKSTDSSTSTPTSKPSESNNEDDSSTSKTPIIAGAAGGAAVLVISIVLVWFFVRRRYKKKMAAASQSFPMSNTKNDGFQQLHDDKTSGPVEVPAPLHSPAPPYQPYGQAQGVELSGGRVNPAVEMGNSYAPAGGNQWGGNVYEAPGQPYR